MEIIILSLCIFLTLLCIGGALLFNKGEKQVEAHITNLRKTASTDPNKILREKAMESSFMERVLFPLAQTIFDKTQEIVPLTGKSFVSRKLIHAGYQKAHFPKVFLGIQLLCTALIFGWFLMMSTLFIQMPLLIALLVSLVFGLVGYGLPLLWLLQQSGRRQTSIQKALPDFLDLLVISVEAGLGLDTALYKIANLESVKISEFLREELRRYTADINLGKPRRDALLDMAERTGIDDFSAIINALVHAYEMGTGVSHTLRVQADSLRVKRLQKAEETANKVPVKMVIPIYIFLFPSIFVVIFGPMAMILWETLANIAKNMGGIQ